MVYSCRRKRFGSAIKLKCRKARSEENLRDWLKEGLVEGVLRVLSYSARSVRIVDGVIGKKQITAHSFSPEHNIKRLQERKGQT